MPKPIKKRVSKKTVIKEEEIRSTAKRAVDFIKERGKSLIIILTIVIAVIILFLVIVSYNSSLKKKAYALEIEAYNYYYGINLKASMTEEERWKKALELYKKSVETKVTPTALFYLGNCYYNLGNYTKAIEEYEKFTKKFKDEEELLPLVYQKLASAYFKNGNSDIAFVTLNRLAEFNNGLFKDTALVLEARYYERVGETEKAKGKYKELIEGFPSSPWTTEASAKIEIQKKERSEGVAKE